MSDPYRTSALPAPSRALIALGTGERLTLHLPLSPAEVVERLGAIAQKKHPSHSELRSGAHRPFRGAVQAPHFRLTPISRRGSYLQVLGRIEPDGNNTVLTLRVGLTLGSVVVSGAMFVGMLVALFFCSMSAERFVYYAVQVVVALGALVFGAIVAVRFRLPRVIGAVVASLDPNAPPGEVQTPAEAPPLDMDALFKRLEEWERKHLE